jgi:hypothetical protein
MNNTKNNIPSNTPSNIPTIDYYNDLKSIKKELEEKIYKQLSKDESFSEMLDNIKNNFINKNISIVEDNISKSDITNYKSFNGKIINILEIIENILRNHTCLNNNLIIKETICDDIQTKIKYTLIDVSQFRITPEELNNIINNYIKETFSSVTDEQTIKILEYIITLKYYSCILRKNDDSGQYLDKEIKRLDEEISKIKSDILNKNKRYRLNSDGSEFKDENGKTQEINLGQLLSSEQDILKKYHEEYKKFYKELCNYLRIYIYEIFDIARICEEKLNNEAKDASKKDIPKRKDAKGGEIEHEIYIKKFKKEIYYNVINIINTRSNDDLVALQDSNNQKIDLESRKKLLAEIKDLLDAQLKKLNDVLNFLIKSNKQEYIEEIKSIKGIFKDYVKEKEYKDPILALIVNEENEIVKFLAINAEETKIYNERIKMKKQNGGERKNNKYYEDKYENIKKLKESIDKLLKKIKETEGIEDNDDPFENKDKKNIMLDPSSNIISIYKNIWNDYIKETKKNKAKGTGIETLKQDDRLYQRFIDNNLDPLEVLKITFQDKVIFICIILIIRTFAMVLIEFLIEYDFINTLFRGILVYSALYILLIILSVIVVNYDSYKLRILVNYLNFHINSSNIFFHILLFVLFNGLILIIINNNDLNNVDNVFNYTYIYKYIYEIVDKSSANSEMRLSQKNKIMLQYRMDIITMIVFIFTSLLILII